MKIAIISDSHTKENIEFIYEYLKKKVELKLDLIIINGDMLGENEIREGYGFGYNKAMFGASLNKKQMLSMIYPHHENLQKIESFFHSGKKDENTEMELAGFIRDYVSHRYNYLYGMLLRFSEIAVTYFNLGTYESPIHYKVLSELAWLLDIPETYIRNLAVVTDYREVFKEFQSKIKADNKRLKYIGGNAILHGDLMIAGVAGFHESSIVSDSMSEFQEKMTIDLINTIRRQLSFTNKLVLLNTTQGKLRKDPFAFRPASLAIRELIEELKGKMRQKVFVQGYHHFMTTHFYEASEFNFILNNSAVNNCIFNILEMGQKISVYDIDPKMDKIRLLNSYKYNLADYSRPIDRLRLNYQDAEEVVKERNLDGCYFI
ncbi:MAG: metallophosphoesterase [Candidatus Woesearchaeota archaeon]|nr:metallophosphoesterase [Candidatus Woesearchaeota archaeon]